MLQSFFCRWIFVWSLFDLLVTFDMSTTNGSDGDNEPVMHEVPSLKGFRKRWKVGATVADNLHESSQPEPDFSAFGDYPDTSLGDLGFMGEDDSMRSWDFIPTQLPGEEDEPYEPSSPVDSRAEPTHHVQVSDRYGTEAAWHQCALASASKRQRLDMPKLPWEHQPFGTMSRSGSKWSGTIVDSLKDMFAPTVIGCYEVINSELTDNHKKTVLAVDAGPPVVRLDVRRVRTEQPDEDIRRVALSKLRDLVLQDPLATQLGVGVNNILRAGGAAYLVEQSIGDCFRSKASSTLQKRSSSLWRLAKLLRQCGCLQPLRLTEPDLYQALCSLRENGAGATSAQHMLESLNFMDATAKLLVVDLRQVISGRCRGVARDMYLTKNPLEQKYPLQLSHVRHLEILFGTLSSTLQCILGQLLFCIHSCCRWKDSQRVKNLSIEVGRGETLIHADAIASKTAISAEARTRFLPYVALGTGVTGEDWGSVWIEARRTDGLEFRDYALPSFSERTQGWTANPMSASEATFWLREFLHDAVDPSLALNYGSHSCKTTLLTWVGRCTTIQFSPTERRLLGHHLEPNMKSILTYSRESYTSLYSKVLMMFKSMRDNLFNPDRPAIERIVQLSETAEPEKQVEKPPHEQNWIECSDSESSVASECGEVEDVGSRQGVGDSGELVSLFPDFPGVPEDSLMVHRVSGLVHAANEDGFLMCGRMPSMNFKMYSQTVGDRNLYEGCSQCKKAFGVRNRT